MAKKIKKRTDQKVAARVRRARRIRNKVMGTAERPRLCVTKTNAKISLQIIDDTLSKTLVSASSPKGKSVNVKLATDLGKEIAKKASAAGIQAVVFDRGGQVFHGRVAAVANGAREGGLKF